MEIKLLTPRGVEYDLLRGEDFRLSDKGVAGLLSAEYEAQVRKSNGRDGQTLTGWRGKERQVFLPFNAKRPGIWEEISQFLKDVRPFQFVPAWTSVSSDREGRYCTITVQRNSLDPTTRRQIQVRFVSDGDYRLRNVTDDPNVLPSPFGLTFMADEPWWFGDEVVSNYSMADTYQPPFFNEDAGLATPFNIIAPDGSKGLYLSNPGDMFANPIIELEGPLTKAYIYGYPTDNAPGWNVLLDYTVGSGQTVTIDTRDEYQIALTDTGENVTRWLNTAEFGGLPPSGGGSQYVNIQLSGLGRGRVRFRPAFWSAV